MMSQPYSVLMSVYAKERPEYLRQSVESMAAQSCPPDEIVLVCDGPLTPELDQTVEALEEGLGELLRVCRLEENRGLGIALREGVALCRNEYIARMDSDDVSLPHRCRQQLMFMEENALDVCSGAVAEFEEDPSHPLSGRALPEGHDALRAFAKRRNPINHPAAMFRKTKVLEAGNYQSVPWFEDYDLWVRMFLAGARFGNLPQTLVNMRVSEASYRRRGGAAYCRACAFFWRRALDRGFITRAEYWTNLACRGAVSLAPNFLRRAFYKNTLRERKP